jgi:hypothetical protein
MRPAITSDFRVTVGRTTVKIRVGSLDNEQSYQGAEILGGLSSNQVYPRSSASQNATSLVHFSRS